MVNNMTKLECFIVDNEDIADVYMADAKYCSNLERKAMYIKAAEKHRQIAELLRELQERRKAPEIVRCSECKQKSFCPSKIDCGNGLDYVIDFCSNGKRAGEEN